MPVAAQIDECLSVVDGRLQIEGCDVAGLAGRFGTPLSVVSEDHLRRNARRFSRALTAAWPEGPARVLPSIKANYTLAVRSVLTQEGLGCDVFGPAELHAALAGGVPPQLISVNGTGKTRALLAQAVGIGARITLDSVREIELVRSVARELGRTAQVRFRMRPRYLALQQPSDFSEASVYETRAGVQARHPDRRADRGRPGRARGTRARRARAHVAPRPAPQRRRDLARVRASAGETIAELAEAWGDWQPRELDLGGGYAAPRDPNRWVPGGDPAASLAPAIEEVVEALASGLRAGLAGRVPLAGVALEIEPGRALHADTGIHVTRVVNLKQQREPLAWSWVETDTTEMFLLDLLVEHCHFPLVAATRMAEPAGRAGRRRRLLVRLRPAGTPGAPARRGAWRHARVPRHRRLRGCLRSQLQRPAEAGDRARERREAEIVRRAETIDDVFARDVVPERLRP